MTPGRRTKLEELQFKLERYFLYYLVRLFRIRDASERVARGFSLGMAVNFFPTFGFGVLISGFFARIFGGNVIAGFMGGATLTFFWPFLFYLNMQMGGWVEGRFTAADASEFTEAQMRSLAWGATFMKGAILNVLLVGGAVYGIWLWTFRYYRVHGLTFLKRMMKRHQQRALKFKGKRHRLRI